MSRIIKSQDIMRRYWRLSITVFWFVVFMVSMLHTPPATADSCAGTRYGADLGCTANDVGITGIEVINGPSSCIAGDIAQFDLRVTISAGMPSRYDIGLFLSNDGSDPQLNNAANSCTVATVPTSPAPFGDLDSNGGLDTCGDVSGGGTGTVDINNIDVECQTSGGSSGYLDIPFVVSWDQNASPTGANCTTTAHPVPGTKSKCNIPGGTEGVIPVVVLPSITKTNNLTAVAPGQTFDYDVVITNTTNTDMSSAPNQVVFKDPLATNITANSVSCSPSGGAACPASSTVAGMQGAGLTIPTLPVGDSVTFTINATINSSIVSGTVTNTASATLLGATAEASDTDTIVPAITKDDGVSIVNAGAYTTYTVTITNNTGTNYSTAGNRVVFTDPVVADIEMEDDPGDATCSASGGAVCPTFVDSADLVSQMQGAGITIDTFPNGGTITFTLVAEIDSGATGTVTNTATATVGGSSRSGSDTNSIPLPGEDPTVDKTHSSDFPIDGQGSWTITVTNIGSDATTNTITVTDDLNTTNFTYVSASGTGWSCSFSSPTVTCTHAGSIASGASAEDITITVDVISASGSPITNTADLTMTGDVNTGNNSDDDPTTITGADLSITKSHTGDFTVGNNNVWTLTVSNNGPLDHTGTVSVTDTLNTTNFDFVSATGTGWGCSWFSPTVTCTRSDSLLSGQTYPGITLTVATLSASGSPVTNTGVVAGSVGDTNTANNSDDDPTTIAATGTTCYAASNGDDQLITRHTGTGTLTDIGGFGVAATSIQGLGYHAVTDKLYGSNADKFMEISKITGAASFIGSYGTADGANGSVALLDVHDIAFDATTGAMYGVHVESGTESLLFMLDVDTGAFVPDAFGSGVDYVEIGTDIEVKGIAVDPTTGTLYGINSDTSTDSLVTINKSDGTTSTVGSLGGTIDDMEDLGTDNLGNIWGVTGDGDAAGVERRLFSINKSTGAATVNGQLFPAGGNTYTEFEGVDCLSNASGLSADVRIVKTVDNNTPVITTDVTYTVTATNLGPNTATTLIVQDTLPVDVTYDSHTASQGDYVDTTGVWHVGTLAPGASATLDITVAVGGTVGVDITNTATRTFHNQTDNDATNDTDSVDITPAAAGSVTTLKTVSIVCDPANFNVNPKNVPGAYVRYDIQISNASGVTKTLNSLTDPLDSNTALDEDLRIGSAIGCETSDPEVAIGTAYRVTCSGATRTSCTATPTYYSAANDTDAIGHSGGTITITFGDGPAGTKLLPTETGYTAGELKDGESVLIRFNAVIQ